MVGYNNWPLIINLGNSIIGVAVLAMPFCFKQCGILLGMLTLLFCTWLTLCSCSLLMKAGIVSRRRSYEFLAYHTHGATGKFISEVGMIGMQMGTLIAQIVVIGDLGPAIISKLLGIENTSGLRTWILILLCLGVGLPMGMLKDLRTVSRGSTVCIAFYCLFVIYILIMSVPNLWSGDWYFKVNFWRPQGLFQCLPILSFSFGCQTQLFLVYEELPEPSLKDISGVISSAVNLCAVAYLLVGFFGYITFHAVEVPGDILAALPSNFLADLMKLCFVFSIVITFPVIIFPCRASIYTLLFAKKTKAFDDSLEGTSYIPENTFKAITITIILSSMITGILIPNVEFILGMNGAIMGTLICYIFPALFFMKVMGSKSEGKTMAQLVLFLGVTILLVSTFATLSSQDKGHTHMDTQQDLMVKPQELEIAGLDRQVPAWPDQQPTVKPNLDDQIENNKLPDDTKEKEERVEIRKEPPVPDPPKSDDKDVPAKVDVPVKKRNSSGVREKPVADVKENVKRAEEETDAADLEAKKKELEEEHKAKELELKEKEKKQEEILEKLDKHRQDQEKLLKEQIEVLKELKDHKEKDETKDAQPAVAAAAAVVADKEKELVKKEGDVKDEIVKRQQELLDQQQKVNQQQQELIQQQQHQINQQILKDQKLVQATVKPPQPAAVVAAVDPQQQQQQQQQQGGGLNPQLQQQQLPLQQQPQQQQLLQQQGLNPQQVANAQQQQVPNMQQAANQQQGLNQQQAVNQQAVNQQQNINVGLNPQQQGSNIQQQALNPQGINIQQQQQQQEQQVLNQQQQQQQQQINPQSMNQGANLHKQAVDLPVAGLNNHQQQQQQQLDLNQMVDHPDGVNKELLGVNKAVVADQQLNQGLGAKNVLGG